MFSAFYFCRGTMELFDKVLKIAKSKDIIKDEIRDLLNITQNKFATSKDKALKYCKTLKLFLGEKIKSSQKVDYLYEAYFNVLVLETPYSLDSYFQALEWNRPVKEKFWLPRRKQLMPIVKKLEDLLINDKLDELFLSMPARTGKSTLSMFAMSWVLGMNSELANLYCSNAGSIITTFYKGILEILTDNYTYLWWKIFPTVKFDKNSFTNAKDTYCDVGRIKRYHSFTARSIDAGLNGAVDVSGLLIGDDLVSGIEEALNQTRLNSLWMKVDNDLLTRAKMGSKVLWIGTRWSINDPIGRRLLILENNKAFENRRFDVVNIPALNENDESNFDYLYDVGFSSDYYLQRKASFEANNDMASFLAQYQGEPIERSGLLFPAENLRFYNGVLPDREPDRKFAFVDIAWGGGDFTSMPIIYQYENELYCVDWVFSPENKMITRPKVINSIIKHDLGSVRFEKNNGGDEYREYVEDELNKMGKKLLITSRSANTHKSKQVKIYEHAPEIVEIYFLEPNKRSKEYSQAIQQLVAYTGIDKRQHDDAPDSLAGIIDMKNEVSKKTTFEIFKRPF